ncbi:MAG TPA: RNB domain-containing ribonuclease [Opitutaceae bacterium]|jgi:ribonuclease R|nr:RNB domain-containing ribonuclease [Opitutaceae bacterium]
MTLRERLLAHLRASDYVPANETGLARALNLKKQERRALAFEVRRLLAAGGLVRIKGDRLCEPGEADLVTGRISFRQNGSAIVIPDGKVNEPGPERPAVFIASEDTDVALHGDKVVARLSTGGPRRDDGRPSGRVIRIVERARDTIVGNLQRARVMFFVIPDDPRLVHHILVPDPAKSKLSPPPAIGDKVVVRLLEWKERNANPEGEIISRLGRTHEPRAELLGIYEKFDLSVSFPAEVEREAAALPARVRPAELAGRLDYREIPTFTIDPDDAKDFDDALSFEELPGGDMRVGVHIADVSSYVRPGTALDREAQRRGNSTYLVGTVIPMLPEKLSNGLCSLVEAEDRLTKAALLTFAKNGRLKQTEFANTVIRSRKRLTYRQAHALLFQNSLEAIRALPLPPAHQTGSTGRALSSLSDLELVDLQSWVRRLWKIAKKLREDRMAAGSLDLDMPEMKVFVDKEGYADRIEKIEHDESHQLIEEFMLSANEAVARLTREQHLPSLYRVHDNPDEEKLQEFRQFVATFGIQAGDLTRHTEVIKLLDALRTHPQGYTLRTQFLRSLKKAVYRASPDGHYGLAKKDYTHFTSPIRRYSDLVVHRVLDFYLAKQAGQTAARSAPGYQQGSLETLAEHLSLTEVNSTEAERESQKIKLLEFFEREVAKKKKTPFAAVITDVRNHGFFVELPEAMSFGLVHASSLTDDFYVLNNAGNALIGRRTKRRFAVGDRTTVVVDKVDRFKRMMDFRVA